MLHGDGRVRATYHGQEDSEFAFDPTDVACDSKRRIIVTEYNNKSPSSAESGRNILQISHV